jgi:hypothetical protein
MVTAPLKALSKLPEELFGPKNNSLFDDRGATDIHRSAPDRDPLRAKPAASSLIDVPNRLSDYHRSHHGYHFQWLTARKYSASRQRRNTLSRHFPETSMAQARHELFWEWVFLATQQCVNGERFVFGRPSRSLRNSLAWSKRTGCCRSGR